MLLIRVDGQWYSTSYTFHTEMTMYESSHAQVIFCDVIKSIIVQQIMKDHTFTIQMTEEQVKLELFLQKEKFKVWDQNIHRFGEKA